MNSLVLSWSQWAPNAGFVAEIAVKSTVWIAALFVAAGLIQFRSRIAASAIWTAGLIGLSCLPMTLIAGPDLALWTLSRNDEPVTSHPSVRTLGRAAPRREPTAVVTTTVAHPTAQTEAAIVPTTEVIRRTSFSYQRTSWNTLLLPAMAMGTVIVLLRLMLAWRATRRLESGAADVDSLEWQASLRRWSAELGLRRDVSLRETSDVNVPIVIGAWRPTILLPEGFAEQAAAGDIDGILAHELAHVRRGDYWSQILLRIVQALYWWQPLIWLAEMPIAWARERVCDGYGVYGSGSSERYAETLLSFADRIARRATLSLGLTLFSTPRLARRLAALETSPKNNPCSLSGMHYLAVMGCVLACATVVGMAQVATASQAKEAAATSPDETNDAAPTDDQPSSERADAGDGADSPRPAADDDSQLAEVIRAWQEQHRRFDAVRFSYIGTISTPAGYAFLPGEPAFNRDVAEEPGVAKAASWPANDQRLKVEGSLLLDLRKGRVRREQTSERLDVDEERRSAGFPMDGITVFDGRFYKSLTPAKSGINSEAQQQTAGELHIYDHQRILLFDVYHNPLLLACGVMRHDMPVDTREVGFEVHSETDRFRIEDAGTMFEGREAVVVETRGSRFFRYWLDADDYRRVRQFNGYRLSNKAELWLETSIGYRDTESGPIPDRWTATKYSFMTGKPKAYQFRLTNFEPDVAVTDADFDVVPLAGTRVYDETSAKDYRRYTYPGRKD